MNIHQLLSASSSSPQAQPQGALGRQDSSNGFFKQALLQASGAQGASQTDSLQGRLNALNNASLKEGEIDSEKLSTALEALGIDISQQDLSALLTQLQTSNSDMTDIALALGDPETSTPLDEIASRLTLISSFTDSSFSAQPHAGQLDTQSLQGEQLKALQALAEQLGISQSQTEPRLALEAIADQLNIDQSEAAQLVSALSALVSQPQGTQPPLAIDTARLTSASAASAGLNAPRTQADNIFTQVSANSASTQISSEALMGALLTAEGTPRGNATGEHLLAGLSLNAGHSSQGTAQPAQGFAPSVPPSQAILTTPITSTAWPQQLGQQLVQISQRGGEQHVQMQLNPAELGPLSISLKFGEQGAQAHFLSAHSQVRQVLEQAIPQLREALAEQGISLGETSVGEQRNPNEQGFAQTGGQQGSGLGDGDINADEPLNQGIESRPLALDGRVDLYA
ncbi:flagellar hook-length control protein FliK [Halovibrio sp. HP20-50]|uniref:flagellar hook-length control protein FliK n=1 Tax=Halovibrio sp. HP20-59 TaxID=3080275 RepID=UPI00294ABFE1|nr:flagellar hook-length control protein FliK [Halovibrio sp. HP20-59]MEA2119476.1 flagellar hook-length control protein FliK [Halovibrio sp. HP20-59]